LAEGNGSFKITKFAFGDDEIDYSLYDYNHASGSAYRDLSILQAPILEAFTNNMSSMKSKLTSYGNNNLLFLPVLKLRENEDSVKRDQTASMFVVCSDTITSNDVDSRNTSANPDGLFMDNIGFMAINSTGGVKGSTISIHQGLDTTEISYLQPLEFELVENQYIVEIDHRLGRIYNSAGNSELSLSYIDDDNIASYYVSRTAGGGNVTIVNNSEDAVTNTDGGSAGKTNIRGPRGTKLGFKIKASPDLQTSTYLFTLLGSTIANGSINTTFGGISASDDTNFNGGGALYYIDTNIRVTGATTGYSIDIPVRFIKAQ
jgi:hypothetical protein